MDLHLSVMAFLVCCSATHGVPLFNTGNTADIKMVERLPEEDFTFAKDYLQQFYHLGEDASDRTKRSDDSMERRLEEMQQFFNLHVTGRLDPQTLEVMKAPRCGVPDVENYSTSGRQNRWASNTLSYSISSYTSSLPPSAVDSIISSALKVWSDVSPLSFVATNAGEADIVVHFARRAHGDFFAFDGSGGTLAHAFAPGDGIGGDTHFDEDEQWSTELNGFNLYLVAAHEFGHSLGLSHSSDPSSLMYPTYRSLSTSGSPLSNGDVQMIQSLYGGSQSISGGNYYNPYFYRYMNYFFPRRLQVEEKCNVNVTFDAVTTLGDTLIFFKGRTMWISQLKMPSVQQGFIKDFLPQVKSNVDAAYEIPSKKLLYIFKGSKYWTVKNLKARRRPIRISSLGFPVHVDHIDAAVHIYATGKTLFFEGDQFWSYDESSRTMDKDNPKNITSTFAGVSGKVDAAFELNGFLHFLSGPLSLKYDGKTQRLIEIRDANTWLGC